MNRFEQFTDEELWAMQESLLQPYPTDRQTANALRAEIEEEMSRRIKGDTE